VIIKLILKFMKRLLQIIVVTGVLCGSTISAHAQRKAEDTSSGRAAYGNAAPDFKAHKKKKKKSRKKAIKSAKRKQDRNNRSSYFTGRPY
jgi:hypothetical protein